MVLWRITVSTDYSPDQVTQKLKSLIEGDASQPNPNEYNNDFADPKFLRSFFKEIIDPSTPRAFGGHVDCSKNTFRLVRDPDSSSMYGNFLETVYQGFADYIDSKCQIVIWVRQRIGELIFTSLVLSFFALLFIWYIISGQISWSIAMICAVPWILAMLHTSQDVRKARDFFEDLFPDRDRRPVNISG